MILFRPIRRSKRILQFLLLLSIFQAVVLPRHPSADLIIVNADVRTIDEKKTRAEAVAVRLNQILAVGTNREIKALATAGTRIIDARGKLVIPGFNDAHVHFMGMGASFSSIDLRDAKTAGEMAERIGFYVNFLPKGRWILGGGWNHENWIPGVLPTRELIDSVTPDHPVFIYHAHAKTALANSLALKIAGIGPDTKAPAGGEIVRDAAGEATGVLHAAAMHLVKRWTPPSQNTDKPAIAEAATNFAAFFGVTSVQDMSVDDMSEVYRELWRQGKLKTRIYDCVSLSDWQKAAARGVKRAAGDGMLRGGCLKSFSDGDAESVPGLYREILAADKADLQIMMHAIGPASNEIVLSIYERVARANGGRDRRFRIEHAHNFRNQDLSRFGRSKIIASLQPALFADRSGQNTAPLRSLVRASALLAFGSDAAIIAINPLDGIYAAVTGNAKDAVSVEEAVRFYTLGSAYAEFQEKVKGSVTPGKLADLVILSDDIFTVNPEEIREAKVLLTMVDGRVVFERK